MLFQCRKLAAIFSLLIICRRLVGAEIEPVRPGPFAVGSTNIEVTPRDDVATFEFLNGKVTGNQTRYLTDILMHPSAVPTLELMVPSDPKLFGPQAGTRIPVALVVLYPTTPDNPRPRYAFPYKDSRDKIFPHMQRVGEKPIFPDRLGRYPLIVFSGGYNTHPLWHLPYLKALAAHGYIVADIVHGDGRGATIDGNTALRPIELHAAIDFLLNDPDFAPAIDSARIGASGQSAGGHTILSAMGGTDPTGKIPPASDARIKAGVGLIPFMGGKFGICPLTFDAWYFGEDHAGLREVRVPFMAIYGEKDHNVPREGVEAGVRTIAGPAIAIMLDGETHDLSKATGSDIYTWELLFFDAWLRGDQAARQLLEKGTSVRGGVNDHKTIMHGFDSENR